MLAGHGVGVRGGRDALFRSIDAGLLADTILAIMLESRQEPEARQRLLRELDETPSEKRQREKRERRAALTDIQEG